MSACGTLSLISRRAVTAAGVLALCVVATPVASASPSTVESPVVPTLAAPNTASDGVDVECTGEMTGDLSDVVVPRGEDCILAGAHVHGDITVQPRGSLYTGDGMGTTTTVDGDITARRARFVMLNYGAQVSGNYRVRGGAAETTTGFDIGVRINGDATISRNRGDTVIDAADVGGDLRVRRNTGFVEVEWNTVGGSTRIRHNDATGMKVFFNEFSKALRVSFNIGAGLKDVRENVVGLSIACQHNAETFVGQPNEAGRYKGQCSEAAPERGPDTRSAE